MKAPFTVVVSGFVLLSLFAYSQDKKMPQKGYYSIYRNAEKLAVKEVTASNYTKADITRTIERQKPAKGYFATAGNAEKLKGTGSVLIKTPESVKVAVSSVITKGYYSIGKNAEKLQ